MGNIPSIGGGFTTGGGYLQGKNNDSRYLTTNYVGFNSFYTNLSQYNSINTASNQAVSFSFGSVQGSPTPLFDPGFAIFGVNLQLVTQVKIQKTGGPLWDLYFDYFPSDNAAVDPSTPFISSEVNEDSTAGLYSITFITAGGTVVVSDVLTVI